MACTDGLPFLSDARSLPTSGESIQTPQSDPRQIDLPPGSSLARRRYKKMGAGARMYRALGGFMQLL
eukprot:5894831-Prymnesium_polylepis.1